MDAFFCADLPRPVVERSTRTRKDRYRANADIGFTDLRSPSLDVTDRRPVRRRRCRVLVIAGDTSHPSLRSVAHRLAAALPDARFVELDDCGHVTYAEQPDAFADAVSVFAAELDAAPGLRSEHHGERRPDRFDVRSADGTSLAVWVEGNGPPWCWSTVRSPTTPPSIRSSPCSATMSPPSPMDRRGFGASGDSPGYTIERDFEDVAAVVDAVAARTGGPVALWGHSYGANCAMGGAALTTNVHHLVLYEPSLGIPYPPGSIDAIEAALARGDHDAAIVAVLVDILRLTEEEIDAFRVEPAVAGPSRRRTHHPEGVPGRGGAGSTGPASSTRSRRRR